MTNAEINTTINKFRGVTTFIGDNNAITACVYFMLFDASYQVFCKKIRTLPLRHQNKKIVGDMQRAYDSFFHRFFLPFSDDQRDFLLEKCDELQEVIAHNAALARYAMMDCCSDEPLERQEKIADLWLCNRFASEALGFYKRVWKKSGFKFWGVIYTKDDADPDICKVLRRSIDLVESLYGGGEWVNEKHQAKLQTCVSALTHCIARWVSNDFKQEKNDKRQEKGAV